MTFVSAPGSPEGGKTGSGLVAEAMQELKLLLRCPAGTVLCRAHKITGTTLKQGTKQAKELNLRLK